MNDDDELLLPMPEIPTDHEVTGVIYVPMCARCGQPVYQVDGKEFRH